MSYAAIKERLDSGRIVILDGAIGTEVLRRDVTWADHQLKKRPDVVRAIHQDYVAAGADVISTNTFQLTRRSITSHFKDDEHMRRIGAADVATRWVDLLREGVALAAEACVGAGRPVAVAGAMTTLEWCFRPDLAPGESEAAAEYLETISVFAEAGADLLLLETVNSTSEAVAAARAAQSVGIPLWVAFVPDENGKLFTGETMADAERALVGYDPDVVLLNCAPPADVTVGLRELAPHRRGAKGVYPHVGRFFPPEWLFTDEYPPDRYLDVARDWVALGAQVLGGCCGTTPEHIALLRSELRTG